MISVLRFSTTQGDFALAIEHVLRILPATELAPLPDATDGVIGMVLEAGTVVPVTDALGAGGSMIVVVEVAEGAVGVLADDVPGVLVVDDGELGPAPAGQRSGLVGGMVAVGRTAAMLIDPEALHARVIA